MRQDFYIYPDIEEAFDEEPWGNSAAVNMSTGHWYIANDQGEIYCLTTAGQKVWRYPNMPVTSFTGWDFTDAAFSGYNVYVVNRTRDSLYVLSDASGMKVGYYAEFGITTAPTIDAQGNVYIGDDSGYVYKLNATGGLIWKHKLNGSIVTSGAINLDGTIYFAADVVLTGYLYALNPDSTLKWSYTVGENVVTTPVIGTDGYIYFGDERGKIHAVNASTGTPKTGWLVNLASTVSTPAFAADGYFYIMTDDQRVFCINCIDGNIRWETPLPTSAKTKSLFGKRENWIPSPVIGSDGDIYVACGRAHRGLYKLQGRSSGIPANTPWPMFRHDRNHSGKAGFIPSR
jgi:outer membrane protein assembly factor BamB